MQSLWQIGVVNERREFSGEARVQIFQTKYFVSYKRKSLKSMVLHRASLYPNTDDLPMSFLVVWIDL